MKTLILILTILVTLTVRAQGVPKYKLYSKIWKFENVNGRLFLSPMSGGNFDMSYDKFVLLKKSIDTNKVKQYLYESFNSFRKDYGKSVVKYSDSLSKDCEVYSRGLLINYEHSNIKMNSMECVNIIDLHKFNNTTKSDGDINRIIAESIFDSFVTSDIHMDLLLSEYFKTYGFGITFNYNTTSNVFGQNNTISIVVRGMVK